MSGRIQLALLLVLLAPRPAAAQETAGVRAAAALLGPLVETYGVSGMEGPVREAVRQRLPAWAHAETDTAGNLLVQAGTGAPLVVFVAHMDEIGFAVTAVRDDGTLDLRTRGGFFSSLYEGRPALVHTARGVVPGVFAPRDSGAATRTPPPLHVDLGTGSRAATEALGVGPGNTVTMPKSFARLAGTRATGRSFDDRVGVTAQLLALGRLDPRHLRHAVLFVFSVREEVGLEGAQAVAARLGLGVARVHAIDTFVSADAPLEPKAYAVAPLGEGAVARALDNSAATPPAYVDSLVSLALRRHIALQVGTTDGGNDGSTFAAFGAPDVAIGWPLRYAHSPAEVIDLRDVASLADLIVAVAEEW